MKSGREKYGTAKRHPAGKNEGLKIHIGSKPAQE
jgi:hypothetical protein